MEEDGWNFNIEEAPKGEWRMVDCGKGQREVHFPALIIAAGSDGVVTPSKWVPATFNKVTGKMTSPDRWNMFTGDVPPLAWKPWPKHPFAGKDEQR